MDRRAKKSFKETAVTFTALIAAAFTVICVIAGVIYLVREYSTPEAFSAHVQKYSFMYGVDANLVYAVIKAESNFEEDAVSAKGARGLMQIMPATEQFIAEKLGVTGQDIFQPETNIRFGVWYLSYLLERFGTRELAAAAYNAGEGTLRRWIEEGFDGKPMHIPYFETRVYVNDVIKFFELYRNKYNY